MAIGDYFIDGYCGYWWLNYHRLLMVILLVAISDYFILLVGIGGYFIGGYW